MDWLRLGLHFADLTEPLIAILAAEVQAEVSVFNLLLGDTDVVQGLYGGGVSEYLLEEQELARIIAAHHHLVITEGLSQRVGCNPCFDTQSLSDFLQHPIYGHPAHRLVLVTASVALAPEHVVVELPGSVLQVQFHGVHHGFVNRDVAVLLNLAGLLGLLLQYRKGSLEGEALVDQVAEPQLNQITDAESEVDAYDEEHVVAVALLLNQVG